MEADEYCFDELPEPPTTEVKARFGTTGTTLHGNWTEPLPVDPELERLLIKETNPPEFDKNTPPALKALRWAIYELIDGRLILSGTEMKKEVERLFQEYTFS